MGWRRWVSICADGVWRCFALLLSEQAAHPRDMTMGVEAAWCLRDSFSCRTPVRKCVVVRALSAPLGRSFWGSSMGWIGLTPAMCISRSAVSGRAWSSLDLTIPGARCA